LRNSIEQSNELDLKQEFKSLNERIQSHINKNQDLIDLIINKFDRNLNKSNNMMSQEKTLTKTTKKEHTPPVEPKKHTQNIIPTGDQNQFMKSLFKNKEYNQLVEFFETNVLNEKEKERNKEELTSQANLVLEALKRIVWHIFLVHFYVLSFKKILI